MSADGSPAIQYAQYLARTTSLTEHNHGPATTDDLTGQIVSYKSEIEALNSEIEAIYSLVLAHEDEVAKALESKNLELAALRLKAGYSANGPTAVSGIPLIFI